ncbi:MAG: hypothetical protein QXK52_06320, partial [Candidatus Bathyarchaeia archaeon]
YKMNGVSIWNLYKVSLILITFYLIMGIVIFLSYSRLEHALKLPTRRPSSLAVRAITEALKAVVKRVITMLTIDFITMMN